MYFCFNDAATTEIYTLSLHDALPISGNDDDAIAQPNAPADRRDVAPEAAAPKQQPEDLQLKKALELLRENKPAQTRSEEHTSELQSRQYLVCRLLLEKKKILTYAPLTPRRELLAFNTILSLRALSWKRLWITTLIFRFCTHLRSE